MPFKGTEMRTIAGRLWWSWLAFLIANTAYNQEVRIVLGPDNVAVNQFWKITVTVENERLRDYSPFPDIPGFGKRGTSSSSSTNFVNGQISSSQSIIQNYTLKREGPFRIPPFTMTINGKAYSSPGKTVMVGPPVQAQRRRDPFGDPFDDFTGRSEPPEFVDIRDEAFLALTVDTEEVYLGEGFTITLAFYIPQDNRAPLEFYELGKQLTDILKEIKPANCWEENFNIENINREPVTVNGRMFSKYKIYQATNYPLNLEPIYFPSVGLKMIKYQVAKNPSFFGRNRKQDFKAFSTKPKTVKVKDLPPHPLKEEVAVGNYRLEERISSKEMETGQSFSYNFTIKGEGNISAIDKPEILEDGNFDFYPPNIKQDIIRSNNRVTGAKAFGYYGIPNEPGEFDFQDQIGWIYFNTRKDQYDTLKSHMVVKVTGESKRNEYILSTDLGSFYDVLEVEDNRLIDRQKEELIKLWANILILAMLIFTAIFVLKR